jgi:hypothetical protein
MSAQETVKKQFRMKVGTIMFGKISLATLGLRLGVVLTSVGAIAYATNHPTLNLAGFFYGLPLILGGLALKSTELKPVAIEPPTPPDILTLRTQTATITQNKIRKDVTRYCYGKDAHLDEALKYLGLNPGREECPVLIRLRESGTDGNYALTLTFESESVPLESWQQQQDKMVRYFGPDVEVVIGQPEPHQVEVTLTKC